MQNRPHTPQNVSAHTFDTPRRRNPPLKKAHGVKTQSELPVRMRTLEAVRDALKNELQIPFDPNAWQYRLVCRISMGYDGLIVAATGLGKSLMFAGVAKLGKKGLAVVVCPLKVLEPDSIRSSRR
ncbi:hypothetical protein D9758_017098 [Tetrapyrgos nigripes]|uniref:DEAD/DEAH box helicase domain-containing protein n=1 Tax=Tetrapyrgos nigripes TaxID=182062 RepID=A0A8H5C2C2_9AGAR|nr:hypothetical protein D9758_017098 [Tetrapyrgos nigripes]